MDWLALTIILSAFTYRVGRLINLDTLFTPIRGPLFHWMGGVRQLRWLLELATCPWCVTVWLAGGSVLAVDHLTDIPVPAPWATIGAVATGSVIFWGYLDSDDDPDETAAKRKAALGDYDEDLR